MVGTENEKNVVSGREGKSFNCLKNDYVGAVDGVDFCMDVV